MRKTLQGLALFLFRSLEETRAPRLIGFCFDPILAGSLDLCNKSKTLSSRSCLVGALQQKCVQLLGKDYISVMRVS